MNIITVTAFFLAFSASANSATAYVEIKTRNDSFSNSGEIGAYQVTNSGLGTQHVALRVIKPAAWRFSYNSNGNRYYNTGIIKGRQLTNGGVSVQNVGLDVQ